VDYASAMKSRCQQKGR